MNEPISSLPAIRLPAAAPMPPQVGAAETGGPSFSRALMDSIEQVNAMQTDANRAVETMATGGDVSPAEVLTAVQKADLAFRLMMQVRNKLVQAYQEVQNVRV